VLSVRVGHGYDVHPLVEGRPMWLGGVHFSDSPVGLLGHSDADALLHALCDALLGAASLGDIGTHFPPTDARHKDRPSLEFLAEVQRLLEINHWEVGNCDLMVLAEMPKINPKCAEMREKIAATLKINTEQISIKATTNERLGFIGRGEGIAVHATVLIGKIGKD
jgi:2-C-methyl-D-erythritol 2,4-cyclodiphosphate synthase